MKTWRIFLPLLAIASVLPNFALAAPISNWFPNCATPSSSGGRTLVVDPAGQKAGTYRDIDSALRAAKPGDTIAFMTGNYGKLTLRGNNQSGFITIAAAPGQRPNFSNVFIGGYPLASHWRLTGLTISGFYPLADKRAQTSLVVIGSSDNIILDHNNLYAAEGNVDWRTQDPKVPHTDGVPSGITAQQTSCVTISDNQIKNVFNGIAFGGDQKGNNGKYFLVSGNSIDNFAGDGIDHYGSHVRIENNRITNGHDICNNQCVHNDGIQGWTYNHMPLANADVTIDGNEVIAQTTPDLAMPVDALQGITIFNGKWDNVKIFNNLVIVNAWHGISVGGGDNVLIINNTVAPSNPQRNTWIATSEPKNDPPGTVYKVVVRNNVVPGKSGGGPNFSGYVSDHNIALGTRDDFADAFVKFDPVKFEYDMHPSKGSPLIGQGSADGAPATDIEGHLRHPPIDVGAYAYTGN